VEIPGQFSVEINNVNTVRIRKRAICSANSNYIGQPIAIGSSAKKQPIAALHTKVLTGREADLR
jgi:hypothetical protein